MEEDPCVPSDEELWASILILVGEAKADALTSLAISHSGYESSQYAIALAEEAKDLYFSVGFAGDEEEFTWVWGVLAESNAYLGRYNEAIDAGLKYQKVFEKHLYDGYPQLRWNMICWYLEAYRFEEAKSKFEELHDRYKYVSELDFSDFEYIEM